MVTKNEIMKALKEIVDPELGFNIIDLGFITGIEIKKDFVKVKVSLTTPLCPLATYIFGEIEEKVKKVKGVKKVEVEYDFENPWTPERVSKEIREKLGI